MEGWYVHSLELHFWYVYKDKECDLHILPKLSNEHNKLTSYSKMNVRLIAQVLSSNVSRVLLAYSQPEAAETTYFCFFMDCFFWHYEHLKYPVSWIWTETNVITIYLCQWSMIFMASKWSSEVFLDELNPVEQRQGNFTKDARQKMFISSQTYEGLKITVNSIIEATQFLLQHQIKYVLTERFCQDPLENYFGRLTLGITITR